MSDISKHILVVGGYGRAGLKVSELLIHYTNHAITLAGRDAKKANLAAKKLNEKLEGKQVYGIKLDISDPHKLSKVLPLYDIMIICVPFPNNSKVIVDLIIQSEIDYIDIVPDKSKNKRFKKYSTKLKTQNRTCLLEAGWEPGLPALLVRLANNKLENQAKDIKIHAVYRDREMPVASITDILDHASMQQCFFKNNRWVKTSILNTTSMSLPKPFGKTRGFHTDLNELQELPQKLDLDSLKLFQGGHNWVSDTILFICTLLNLPKDSLLFNQCVTLYHWANRKLTNPVSAGVIKVMASNGNDSVTLTTSNKDLYKATAIPVVASILLMDQKAVLQGVGFMGCQMPPEKMMKLLIEIGIKLSTTPN